MTGYIGDLRLKITLAGEPSRIRTAYNHKFTRYRVRAASLSHQRRLRFDRPYGQWRVYVPSEFDLGQIEPGSKLAAESRLSQLCHMMEAADIRDAQQLIDALHDTVTNLHALAEVGESLAQFWLVIGLEEDAPKLIQIMEAYLRKDIIEDATVGIFLRDGRPPVPKVRWLVTIDDGHAEPALYELERLRGGLDAKHIHEAKMLIGRVQKLTLNAAQSRAAVLEERARTVLGDRASEWLGSMARWHQSYWTALVELDFISRNFAEYVAKVAGRSSIGGNVTFP